MIQQPARQRAGFDPGGNSFNLISVDDVQGTPLAEMTLDDFEQPIRNALRSTFLTARAAARHIDSLVAPTMLGRGAMLDDVGNVAAFAASDHARTITASSINISCGAIVT
jgi:enoyl-[acyl-carrier-protein] reductase (NADH)